MSESQRNSRSGKLKQELPSVEVEASVLRSKLDEVLSSPEHK